MTGPAPPVLLGPGLEILEEQAVHQRCPPALPPLSLDRAAQVHLEDPSRSGFFTPVKRSSIRGNSAAVSVNWVTASNSSPLRGEVDRPVGQACSSASIGLNGASFTSGKNGNMLFFASGVTKWILVPSCQALSTWLAKQLSRLNQRMSSLLHDRRGADDAEIDRQAWCRSRSAVIAFEPLPAIRSRARCAAPGSRA